jgi:hypothetical protein
MNTGETMRGRIRCWGGATIPDVASGGFGQRMEQVVHSVVGQLTYNHFGCM